MIARGLPQGTRLGDFVVDVLVGVGGMGQVYRAHQDGVDRPVALKVLSPALTADPAFVRRFRREAGMMRDLEHPGILSVYAAGEDDGLVYLATRLVSGPTLAQVLETGRPAPAQALEILRPIAEALDHAHGRGVIHRDVKPSNILVDADGRPFLSDFGISKDVGTASTLTGQYFGTPRYMAPEQAAGGAAVGHRADLYALACVAFEMFTGSAPYTDADTVPLLLAHASRPVPRASALDPSLPAALDDVLARGLAKLPGDRFPSGRAFLDDVERAFAAPPVGSRRGRRRVLIGAGIAAAVLVAAIVGTSLALTAPAGTGDRPGTALPTATASAPTSPSGVDTAFRPSAPALADVARGELVYAAAMDGTPGGFVVSPATEADSAREGIRYVPGGLELEAYAAGGNTYSELALARGVTTYIGEMDVSVRPGTAVDLCWSLRWAIPRQLSNYVCLDTATGSAVFSVFRRGEDRLPIGEPTAVADLASGRTVRLAVVVREQQLSLYVDGRLALDVANDEVFVARTLPGIELESDTGTGLVRIEGLRIYELAEVT